MTNLPCPICGREMTAFETHPGRGELYCEKCDLLIGGDNPKTPDELRTIVEESRYSTSSKQVKRLKGEITKLRTIYRLQEHLTDMHAKRECELMEENANLRKFAHDLYEFAELYDEEKDPRQWSVFIEQMRKFGIEVPDGYFG